MSAGLILITDRGEHRAGLPAVPERAVYWARVERIEAAWDRYIATGPVDQDASVRYRGATSRELRLLAESLAMGGSRDVALLGSPGDSDAGAQVAAIRYGGCLVLSSDALGDITPEEADALGVGSATAAARLIVQEATGKDGREKAVWPEAADETMSSCAWSGPMACYQGAHPGATLWDQSRAYLRAWEAPLPIPGAPWRRIPAGEPPRTDGSEAGWVLVDLEQPGLYPAVPAHSGGSYWTYPVTRGVVPVSIMALPVLVAAGAVVHGYLGGYACSASPVDFKTTWEAMCPRKAAYQRAHAAMDPGDRHTARPGFRGWRWEQDTRPAWQRRPWAGLIRWAPAAETAAALLRAGACGAEVTGAHIDSLTVSTAHGARVCEAGRSEAVAADPRVRRVAGRLHATIGAVTLDAPERWTPRASGSVRQYGVGTYEIRSQEGTVVKAGDMSGRGTRASTGEIRAAMRQDREWSSDPEVDPGAVSMPLAVPRHPWYQYTLGADTVSGHHDRRQAK